MLCPQKLAIVVSGFCGFGEWIKSILRQLSRRETLISMAARTNHGSGFWGKGNAFRAFRSRAVRSLVWVEAVFTFVRDFALDPVARDQKKGYTSLSICDSDVFLETCSWREHPLNENEFLINIKAINRHTVCKIICN
jgi:hypothetical protein